MNWNYFALPAFFHNLAHLHLRVITLDIPWTPFENPPKYSNVAEHEFQPWGLRWTKILLQPIVSERVISPAIPSSPLRRLNAEQ